MNKDKIIHLFQEIGMLSSTPRSGFAFLGSGKQSVAEHSYRMTLIAYFLADYGGYQVDKHKLLLMCLLHDFYEARTGDHNYVNKKYIKVIESKLLEDITACYGTFITKIIKEYDEKETVESLLAHEADQLELLLVLKQESDMGNSSALKWFTSVMERLKTSSGKELALEIQKTSYDAWWTN